MSCPIEEDTHKLIVTSKELMKAVRKLRRDLIHCEACAAGETCQLRSTFHAMIDTAIDEVNQEWNLPIAETRP